MGFLLNILFNGLAVYASVIIIQMFFPGANAVTVKSYPVAIFVSVVMGLVNSTIRPILKLITFPITIITLGLFGLILNGLVLLFVPIIVNAFVPGGFAINGVLWAIAFSILVTFLQSTFAVFVK